MENQGLWNEGSVKLELDVNGLTYTAAYRDRDIEDVFLPLLRSWSAVHAGSSAKRTVVLLAAPPGTGKTTLALFLERLAATVPGMPRVQALGMDGFHYPNAYLDTHEIVEDGEHKTLRSRKGAPFTFDVEALATAVADLKAARPRPWPAYSRESHDVVPAAIEITGEIALVEGNYLLLDEPGWRDLAALADRTVFLSADADMLRERLVVRKVAGGMDRAAAQAWYEASDDKNVRAVLGAHVPADIELSLSSDGSIIFAR